LGALGSKTDFSKAQKYETKNWLRVLCGRESRIRAKLVGCIPLRFIESNFGIDRGALGFSDARAKCGMDVFFDLTRLARRFKTIKTAKTADFFLNDKRPTTAPDDD
jgi:hypothetical protein